MYRLHTGTPLDKIHHDMTFGLLALSLFEYNTILHRFEEVIEDKYLKAVSGHANMFIWEWILYNLAGFKVRYYWIPEKSKFNWQRCGVPVCRVPHGANQTGNRNIFLPLNNKQKQTVRQLVKKLATRWRESREWKEKEISKTVCLCLFGWFFGCYSLITRVKPICLHSVCLVGLWLHVEDDNISGYDCLTPEWDRIGEGRSLLGGQIVLCWISNCSTSSETKKIVWRTLLMAPNKYLLGDITNGSQQISLVGHY